MEGGSGAIINGGGGSVSVTGSFFSVSSGVGFSVTGSGAELGGSYTNFTVSGNYFMPYTTAQNLIQDAKTEALAALAAANAIGPCPCP